MKRHYRYIIVSSIISLTLTTPIARADDSSLWPSDVKFSHSYAFVAPVIADEWLYFPSFSYSTEMGWFGQLMKFRFTEQGTVLDLDGVPVLDCQGNLLPTARSFWNTSNTENAVNTMLQSKHARRIFTDSAESLRLTELSDEKQANVSRVLGDSMHGRPVVLDYGHQHRKQDRRILLATNAGMLHLFSDNTNILDESWAFAPEEFLSRRTDDIRHKSYALDGELSLFHDDVDEDGIIEAAEGDRLWLFFGVRQGGRSYYAMDLTDPDHPALKWKINGNDTSSDFALLGESWSVPQLAYISANNGANQKRTPVVIIGGGKAATDNTGSVNFKGSGRAIYIIDAESGRKLFSVSPENSSLTNLQAPFYYSIPASVALLDSDLDGFDDRLYVGDTGGNVWRLDMNGSFADWQISKLASLGGSADIAAADADSSSPSSSTLHFFGQPVIARSLLRVKLGEKATADVPADWVLLGSGNRDEVIAQTSNRYYALPDRQVMPYTKHDPIPAPLSDKDLHQAYSQKAAHQPSDVFMHGWYIDVAKAQIFGNGYVIAGNVWFTSFTPTAKTGVTDSISIGTTRLYQIELVTGSFPQAQAVVSQSEDRLLENPGLAYQDKYQQLWLTGVSLPSSDTAVCASGGMLISDALQPRRIAEYVSGN